MKFFASGVKSNQLRVGSSSTIIYRGNLYIPGGNVWDF